MSKFDINNKIATEGIKLEDLQKLVKKEEDKKLIESIFNEYNSNNDDVLDANEQVSLFAALKNSDKDGDNKLSKDESNEKFKTWKLFTKVLDKFLKGNDKTATVNPNESGEYNVEIDSNSRLYDKSGKYQRTEDNLGRTIETSDENYVYTYEYAENSDKEASPQKMTRKTKAGGEEISVEKNDEFTYSEDSKNYCYRDSDGNMYDKDFKPGYRIQKSSSGAMLIGQHGNGEMTPEQILVPDNTDPNNPKTDTYMRDENGNYKKNADETLFTYDAKTSSLTPVPKAEDVPDNSSVVLEQDKQKVERPKRVRRRVHRRPEWRNNQAELAKKLDLNQYNKAEDVLDAILEDLGATNLPEERKEKLLQGLIKYNPSMFNVDGSVHDEANFSKLDFPKLKPSEINSTPVESAVSETPAASKPQAQPANADASGPVSETKIYTEQDIYITAPKDHEKAQEQINMSNQLLLDMMKDNVQLIIEEDPESNDINIKLADGRSITIDSKDYTTGNIGGISILYSNEIQEGANRTIWYGNDYIAYNADSTLESFEKFNMPLSSWSNIKGIVEQIVNKVKQQQAE